MDARGRIIGRGTGSGGDRWWRVCPGDVSDTAIEDVCCSVVISDRCWLLNV